jgi:ABC-2 type transport system permease protein
MRNTLAIMQRELLSLFLSPIGYVVIAGFLVLTGVIVWVSDSFGPGKPASLRSVFEFAPYVLSIIIPAICMRAISEEYRSGTFESLITATVSDGQLVLGKFLAAMVFYVVMLGGTLIYVVLMASFGNPDLGAALSSYLGLLLLGAMFAAIGIFASSLTRDQMVAWIVGAVPLMLFVWFASSAVQGLEGTPRLILQTINIRRHLELFNQGLVTLEGSVFFLASAALFLFLSTKVVESRRWR